MINAPKIYKMRIVFRSSKKLAERNHIFNAVRNMVLSSGLPFEPAKVNKNWPRLAYGPAAAFGVNAEREYLDIYLQQPLPATQVRERLEAALPNGIELTSVTRVPYALPSVQNLATVAKYRVEGDFAIYGPEQTAEAYFNAPQIQVTRTAENGLTLTSNVKPYVLGAEMQGEKTLSLTLACVEGKWIKPQTMVASWLGIEIPPQDELFTVEGFTFIREGLFWQDSEKALHLI